MRPRQRSAPADPHSQAILDFNQDLDIALLDRIVNVFYSGSGPDARLLGDWMGIVDARSQQQSAQRTLTRFQEHPDAWQRVPKILSESGNPQTKVRTRTRHAAADGFSTLLYRLVAHPQGEV